jgi:hypothetical protein
MNSFGIKRAYERKKECNYEKTYWAIDLHGVILYPTYSNEKEYKLAPYSKQVLQYLSLRKDMVLILWTSSYEKNLDNVLNFLAENNIYFDYINQNPEVSNNLISNFNMKFYFDILLDDKAGFNLDNDWMIVWNNVFEYFLTDVERKNTVEKYTHEKPPYITYYFSSFEKMVEVINEEYNKRF